MRSILFIAAVLVCVLYEVKGQNVMQYMTVEGRFSKNTDVDGTPYVFDTWATGYIVFKNTARVNDAKMRYDAFDNIIEVNLHNVDYTTKIENVTEMGCQDKDTGKKMLFKEVKTDKGGMLLEIISEGKVIFGYQNKVKRVKGTSSGNSMENLNAAKDKLQLFKIPHMVKDGVATEFSATKKSVLGVLQDKKDEMDAYMDDKKLNVKKEEDLKAILEYYNSLK